jgi:hypothetical protein
MKNGVVGRRRGIGRKGEESVSLRKEKGGEGWRNCPFCIAVLLVVVVVSVF